MGRNKGESHRTLALWSLDQKMTAWWPNPALWLYQLTTCFYKYVYIYIYILEHIHSFVYCLYLLCYNSRVKHLPY